MSSSASNCPKVAGHTQHGIWTSLEIPTGILGVAAVNNLLALSSKQMRDVEREKSLLEDRGRKDEEGMLFYPFVFTRNQ